MLDCTLLTNKAVILPVVKPARPLEDFGVVWVALPKRAGKLVWHCQIGTLASTLYLLVVNSGVARVKRTVVNINCNIRIQNIQAIVGKLRNSPSWSRKFRELNQQICSISKTPRALEMGGLHYDGFSQL